MEIHGAVHGANILQILSAAAVVTPDEMAVVAVASRHLAVVAVVGLLMVVKIDRFEHPLKGVLTPCHTRSHVSNTTNI
jgi:hypothetical protein